ncbi:hypothetical protein NQZ68_016993 [Dissostichus eleginoides]|nr:hypothetical protein NQZ68_016993 [Dissostichus eleginoides]
MSLWDYSKIKREEEADEQQHFGAAEGRGTDSHRERVREMTMRMAAEAGFDRSGYSPDRDATHAGKQRQRGQARVNTLSSTEKPSPHL